MATNTNATSGVNDQGRKVFLPLENNPSILNPLAHALGLSPSYAFHDLYSFSDEVLLALVPRPALALLFVYPETPGARAWFRSEVDAEPPFDAAGEDPVLWFRQIVVNACGLMGAIHCTLNAHHALPDGGALNEEEKKQKSNVVVQQGSVLDRLRHDAIPLQVTPRADLVPASAELEREHAAAAVRGDTVPPALGEEPGHAFIAFVRGVDGCLYEMDGGRNGPKLLGRLGEGEDVLSETALELSVRPYLKREEGAGAGVLGGEFSCTVLAPVEE